ncbi:hypothetical protein GCM10010442_15820 [Kitasatospora kifunensis]
MASAAEAEACALAPAAETEASKEAAAAEAEAIASDATAFAEEASEATAAGAEPEKEAVAGENGVDGADGMVGAVVVALPPDEVLLELLHAARPAMAPAVTTRAVAAVRRPALVDLAAVSTWLLFTGSPYSLAGNRSRAVTTHRHLCTKHRRPALLQPAPCRALPPEFSGRRARRSAPP